MSNILGSWRYKISFKNLVTGKREWYVGGLLFTEQEADDEIRLLQQEQFEEHEKNGKPITRIDFTKHKRFIPFLYDKKN